MGLRALLQPWLGNAVPFVLAFPALIGVHAVAGRLAAITAALGCALWALLPWLPPSPPPWHTLVFLLAAVLTILFLDRILRPLTDGEEGGAGSPVNLLSWLRIAIAMSLVLPAVLFASVAWHSYGEVMDEVRVRVERAAKIASEHASKVMETNTVVTRQLLMQLEGLDDDAVRARGRALHDQLMSATLGIKQIHSVQLWDAVGQPVASSLAFPPPAGQTVKGREDFNWCQSHPRGTYVSQPLAGRLPHEALVQVSTCRTGQDGRLAGMLSVAMRPDYFRQFYERMSQSEPGLVLTLLRDDGVLLARYPSTGPIHGAMLAASQTIERMRSGAAVTGFDALRLMDGTDRMVSLRRLDQYPLYVCGGIDRSLALAAWQTRVTVLAAVIFPAGFALAYVASVALRRAVREMEALDRLRAESEQRLRAEQALRHAQKLEALGQLTGGVAHDFNNLLMVISTNAYLLSKLHPDTAQSKPLAAVQRAVSSGTKLTRQLLAFSRRQALRPQTLRLQETLPPLADLLRMSLGSTIAISIDVAPETAPITVDVAELELALLNLTINARDAMPEGGSLTITARNGVHPGAVDITVSDTGRGIPASLQERVFEPFFTTKGPGEGTGLGLSQVYGFCAQAGGSVSLRSREKVGTSVVLTLPATPDSAVIPATPETPIQSVAGTKVLLVEDNMDVAQATFALLGSLECDGHCVANAEEAKQALAQDDKRFDLVLTDVIMPGAVNGVALASHVRQHHPQVAVLLMTGYSTELSRARQEGFEVLPKPFDAKVLARAIGAALGR